MFIIFFNFFHRSARLCDFAAAAVGVIMIYAVTCWARFTHTSTAARSMSAAIQFATVTFIVCGVPQVSVLGPVLFVLYGGFAPVGRQIPNSGHMCTLTTRR